MNLKEYKAKKMNDPEFVKAYEEIQPEMNVIRAIIDARISQNISQKELAERTGIAQTEISKLENGTRNPSIKLLQRLADGMDEYIVYAESRCPKMSLFEGRNEVPVTKKGLFMVPGTMFERDKG